MGVTSVLARSGYPGIPWLGIIRIVAGICGAAAGRYLLGIQRAIGPRRQSRQACTGYHLVIGRDFVFAVPLFPEIGKEFFKHYTQGVLMAMSGAPFGMSDTSMCSPRRVNVAVRTVRTPFACAGFLDADPLLVFEP